MSATAAVKESVQEPSGVGERTSSTTLADLTTARFADLPVDNALKRALAEVVRFDTMTSVQNSSIPVSLTGGDVLVKARTGTGKTLAFLLPALHRAIADLAASQTSSVSVLVISPTRELAQQIADEGAPLMSFIPGSRIQVVVGGTSVKRDNSRFRDQKGPPTLLVGTPGRLLDHLSTAKSGFAHALKNVSVVVLDEADRLLDMGFAPDLQRIFSYLPATAKRQTLLFSATMPPNVAQIAKMAMKPDYNMIDCVGEESNTHDHVPQHVLVMSVEDQIASLALVLKQCAKVENFKVIVFFVTARSTQFFAELFEQLGVSVLETHSRKSQSHRTKVSNKFRKGNNEIMFSSDVSARGMDYPDVTAVIQVGLPADKAQYVHRIGRTARAGKSGSGILLLCDFEAPGFLSRADDLNLKKMDAFPRVDLDKARLASLAAAKELPEKTIGQVYQATLGYYNSCMKSLRMGKPELVRTVNSWITDTVGEAEVPALLARTVGKMGLKGTPGLRIEPAHSSDNSGRRRAAGRGESGNDDRRGGRESSRGRDAGSAGRRARADSVGPTRSTRGEMGSGAGGRENGSRGSATERGREQAGRRGSTSRFPRSNGPRGSRHPI